MNQMIATEVGRTNPVGTPRCDDLADDSAGDPADGFTDGPDGSTARTQMPPSEPSRSDADHDPRPTTRQILGDIIGQGGPQIVFQSIHHLESGQVIGAEALSRFPSGPTTKQWFDEAARFGLGDELELSAIAATVRRLDEPTWVQLEWNFVGLNLSPDLVFDARFGKVIAGYPADRLMVELTEPSTSIAFASLRQRLEELRSMGMRIAVNSAKCELSNLVRLMAMAPEVIKLDVSFTAALVREPARRAIATDILRECTRGGVFVVAVGVEHDDEVAILRELGVDAVQGHLFGQPRPIEKPGQRPVSPSAPR